MPPTPKDITLDELARMTQGEFAALRETMVTKDALAAQTQALMSRMDSGFSELAQAIGSVKEDVRHWKQDILELQERVADIEKRLGISR